MNELQIAKFIQIVGIFVGTGFGTILLNREVVGKLAQRINEQVFSLGNTVTNRYINAIEKIFPKRIIPLFFTEAIGASMVIFSSWAIFSIALQRDIMWVFWLSVSILSLYATIALVDAILRFFIHFPRRYPLWSFPLLLTVRILSGLVISPIFMLIFLLINYSLIAFVIIFKAIAGRDIVRRGLIIAGFILVLTSLIWELFLIS